METQDNGTLDLHLKIQALADNELPEEEIPSVLDAIQGSYEYRQEYAALLQLKKRLAGVAVPAPGHDWVAKAERNIFRKLFRGTGSALFIGSYLALLGAGLFVLFTASDIPRYITIPVALGVGGALLLLGNAIADRVRERKTDKYRGVVR